MNLKILESSLNLRVEKGKTNMDYKLLKDVAVEQLSYPNKDTDIDLYCNVEYMKCQDEEYLCKFSEKYKRITALFGKNNRGILCHVKREIKTQIITKMDYPHFLHFRIFKDDKCADIIVFRILVSDSTETDFIDRFNQWNIVMRYIETEINDKSKLIVMGDWNHAYIRREYKQGEHVQIHFNYQLIKTELEKMGLKMGINIGPGHKEHSYKGYLAIDHIAIGKSFAYNGNPYYSKYHQNAPIGKPDHAYLFADVII